MDQCKSVLHIEHYPLPHIEDLFAPLAGGQCFSKVDLSHAYLQMNVDEESGKYLTISTQKGLFQYNRLPFGIPESYGPGFARSTKCPLLPGGHFSYGAD